MNNIYDEENKRTYHTSMAEDNLQKLIDKIEDAS
jgi:hypothetical protein